MQNKEIQAQVCLTDIRYYFFHVINILMNEIHCKLPRKISNSAATSIKTSYTNFQPFMFSAKYIICSYKSSQYFTKQTYESDEWKDKV